MPFGRGTRVGVVVSVAETSEVQPHRLRRIAEVIDERPVLDAGMLDLLGWVASYYHYPLGEVVCGALPGLLRRAQGAAKTERRWLPTEEGSALDPAALTRAPRQRAVLETLQANPAGLDAAGLREACGGDTGPALRALEARGLVEAITTAPAAPEAPPCAPPRPGPALNPDQAAAATAILDAGQFECFLLDGVTGSGKTEVYFAVAEGLVRAGRQILILVPEIGLTPQLVARIRARFPGTIALLHSGLGERERLEAWRAAADGRAAIIVGTRSAVFTPAPRLGAIIVDEEHDPSYKQQESLRYSARDVAVMRARKLAIPVVLGSATPSLESVHNAGEGRYRRLSLPRRAGVATPPKIRLVDLRADRPANGLSAALTAAIEEHLARDNQVLLFLNRRGYAPTLLCEDCGWIADCPRCDSHLIVHQARRHLRCHHCDTQRPLPEACPECARTDLRPIGQGTERMEETVRERFPQAQVLRIDRDSTRRRGALEALMADMRTGRQQILLGTQMLAKGHDLPNVTLAAILDADQGLFGADFRAVERMGQLLTQVAGRAGRADKPGEVIVQTRCPDHPLLHPLLAGDYATFAATLLDERRQAGLPPWRAMAMIRAESVHQAAPAGFLARVRERAHSLGRDEVELLGPAPAPMERRAGRFRAQLLFLAHRRAHLHQLLGALAPELDRIAGSGVRWSLDVDPSEEF